ncbi:MAG TPA: redoxin family protein [Thermoanaerobaculia bacterium]|nr:redoxin family protein [Thermoanaerobaculia bacterium]
MNKAVLISGLVIFAALVGVLFLNLGHDPSAIDSPLIGKPAPNFALKAVGSGQMLDIASLRGKPAIINFWATWCGPCYEEHPVLVQNARVLGNDVQFVGVVFNDTEQKIQAFLNQRGSAYPTLLDEQGKTAVAYGVGGVPETFFLDRSGTIVAKYTGPLSTEELQANLAKAMK